MKRFVITTLIALGLQVWSGGAIAADEPALLTLKQAWDIALKNHPRLQSDELLTRATEQDIDITRSNFLPQVWGSAVGAGAANNTRIAASGGINNPLVIGRGSLGVSLSQLITDFGRTENQLQAAKAQADAAAAQTADTREQVLLGVTQAYYDALRAQALLHVAEATLAARNQFLGQITVMHDVGRRSDLDLSIARQQVAEAELLQTQAQGGVDDAFAVLSQALGYGGQRKFALQVPSTGEVLPSDFDALARQAIDQNPELRALRAKVRAARLTYEAERALNYPTVSAVGYAGVTPFHDNNRIDDNYTAAGIVLNMPLYTGGRLSAEGQKAELYANALGRDLQARENELARYLRLAWNGVQTAYKSIDTSKQMLDSANKALELTSAGYQIGRNSIVDLSQVQLNQVRAEITNVNAVYDYSIQRAVLEYRVGDLSATPPQ